MALNINKHRSILINILKDIYTDTTLGPVLGFKGSTDNLKDGVPVDRDVVIAGVLLHDIIL